ncbi:MAG: diaminopimelate epimerase [bacterium]|nr:diaminopimelate epimerase [bacterium]
MKRIKIPFIKYNSTGNDFIIVDNRRMALKNRVVVPFSRTACRPRTGIGADGLLLLEKSRKSDFTMRIINADGSEAEMCGNGSRAIAHFARSIKAAGKKMEFDTLAGLIRAEIRGDQAVKVELTKPFGLRKGLRIGQGEKAREGYFLNTGVPHVVLFMDDLEDLDVFKTGRFIRYHDLFKPAGTNVNFVRIISRHSIEVRTYERGVENETLACGTGATASAILSSLIKGTLSPVTVRTRGREILKIYFRIGQGDRISQVFLEGRVLPVFSGVTEFDGKILRTSGSAV